MIQVLTQMAKILGLHTSPDFAPLRSRNGAKSGDQERQIEPIRLDPALPA
jgi:hypothetical protein